MLRRVGRVVPRRVVPCGSRWASAVSASVRVDGDFVLEIPGSATVRFAAPWEEVRVASLCAALEEGGAVGAGTAEVFVGESSVSGQVRLSDLATMGSAELRLGGGSRVEVLFPSGLEEWEEHALAGLPGLLFALGAPCPGNPGLSVVSMGAFSRLVARFAAEHGEEDVVGLTSRWFRVLEQRGLLFRRAWSAEERTRNALFVWDEARSGGGEGRGGEGGNEGGVGRFHVPESWLDLCEGDVSAMVRVQAAELAEVGAEIQVMETLKDTLETKARRQIRWGAVGVGVAAALQYGVLTHLIFEWSWDVVEPVAALVTAIHSAIFYAFFLFSRGFAPTEDSMMRFFLRRRTAKLLKAHAPQQRRDWADLEQFEHALDALKLRQEEIQDDLSLLLARARIPAETPITHQAALQLANTLATQAGEGTREERNA